MRAPLLAGSRTATDNTCFGADYPFYSDPVAASPSGVLLSVYRHRLGVPGQYHDPVRRMRSDGERPTPTHDDETHHLSSKTRTRAFEDAPTGFAERGPFATADDTSVSVAT